jgi:hypothetical protein
MKTMVEWLNQHSSARPPNSSLFPRGFGSHYVWVRLRVYLILIAFIATSFGAVAAGMANLYFWTVLTALFWMSVGYAALPAGVKKSLNQKLEELDKYSKYLPQPLQHPAFVAIVVVIGIMTVGLLKLLNYL